MYTPASTILIAHSHVPHGGLPHLALPDSTALTGVTRTDRGPSDEEVIKEIVKQRWKSNTTAKLKLAGKGMPRLHLSTVC